MRKQPPAVTSNPFEANLIPGHPKPPKGKGGRPKGALNKVSIENRALAFEIAGIIPLEVLLEGMARNRDLCLAMWDKRHDPARFVIDDYLKYDAATRACAEASAKYIHHTLTPKKPELELPQLDIEALTNDQLGILIVRIRDRLGAPRAGALAPPADPSRNH